MEVMSLAAVMKVSQFRTVTVTAAASFLPQKGIWRPDLNAVVSIGWASSEQSADLLIPNRQRTGSYARRDGGARLHFQNGRLMPGGGLGTDPLLFGV
jgi:hypothetical protein